MVPPFLPTFYRLRDEVADVDVLVRGNRHEVVII